MMGILVPETCWGNKTAYFVASSCFFIFHCVYDARSHEHQNSPATLHYFMFLVQSDSFVQNNLAKLVLNPANNY
jgi:hypothetical protein